MTSAPDFPQVGWSAVADAGARLTVLATIRSAVAVPRVKVSVGDTDVEVRADDTRAVAGLRYLAPVAPGAYGQSVTVTDACGREVTQRGPTLTVRAPAPPIHTLTFAGLPDGSPNPSVGPVPVKMDVGAVDSHGHALSYLWQSICAETASGGTFRPANNVQSPLWDPPSLARVPQHTGALQCLIRVTVIDSLGLSISASFVQVRRAS